MGKVKTQFVLMGGKVHSLYNNYKSALNYSK